MAFCQTCGTIQPTIGRSFFARLELEPGFDIDGEALESNYFMLQHQFHPDRFAAKSAREREYSLQHATDLNEAFQVLKSPVRRAEYLLGLAGLPVAGSGQAHTTGDEAILMEAMEMREALAEAETTSAVQAIIDAAGGKFQDCLGDLGEAFRREDLEAAAALTVRLTYLQKIVDEARVLAGRIARLDSAP